MRCLSSPSETALTGLSPFPGLCVTSGAQPAMTNDAAAARATVRKFRMGKPFKTPKVKFWTRSPRSAVLDAAAVRRGRGRRYRLAGLELVEGGDHVVLRGLHVRHVGRALVVDRAVVDHLAAA